MKLQHIAIIFIIIILPISLVLSNYVSSHLETIKTQTIYDANLVNAAHDSIRAFQINTQNKNIKKKNKLKGKILIIINKYKKKYNKKIGQLY